MTFRRSPNPSPLLSIDARHIDCDDSANAPLQIFFAVRATAR
ncbi:hypothetical protein BURPS1710A_2318 [Burkholderia pseudomallei 1710a]|uniref:Uncharacterized protein n=1 Tax=Burkholderia pseudomallei 1710a TaxID=320371 RepID=A0A0E1W4C3_BURPE|nr:hypothetical protein BURPS1710A_2318 [Burkholderia pseudomallei 1710a]